jgi:hypothetical protein
MNTVCQSGNLRRRDHCGDLCIDGDYNVKGNLETAIHIGQTII